MRVFILSKRGIEEYENRRLVEELRLRGCDVSIHHPDSFYIHLSDNSLIGPDLGALPDIVLSRTGSGTTYHCFNVMRQFEAMGVKVINSAAAVKVAMDKIETMQLASRAGVPIPKTLISHSHDPELILSTVGFPCIVKLPNGSYGNGVGLCHDATEFRVLNGFIHALDRSHPILVQEYIGDRVGSDVRVHVVGGKAIAAMKRSSKSGDFRANISAGGVGENFSINAEIAHISETITRLCGLEISGIDLLFKGDNFVLCEANAAAGFMGCEEYLNINVAAFIADYIMLL